MKQTNANLSSYHCSLMHFDITELHPRFDLMKEMNEHLIHTQRPTLAILFMWSWFMYNVESIIDYSVFNILIFLGHCCYPRIFLGPVIECLCCCNRIYEKLLFQRKWYQGEKFWLRILWNVYQNNNVKIISKNYSISFSCLDMRAVLWGLLS